MSALENVQRRHGFLENADMANFIRTKYQADDGTVHALRLSQAKSVIAGAAPAGAVNSSVKAKVSKSNREFGIRPRGVTIAMEVGADPDTFQKYAFIPILTETVYESAAYQLNANLTYDGDVWQIISRVAEDY